jgi:hypothetical protein
MKIEDPLVAKLDPDQVQRAAQGMTAALHRVAKTEKLKLVAATLGLLLGASTAFYFGHWPLGLFALIMIVGSFLHLQKESRRRRMGVALPFVLQALGLEQTAAGMEFNQSLPARLFPRVAEPLVSSVFFGTIDGYPVAVAEVRVKDPTDDSDKEIFEGLVLRVGLSRTLPDFLILDDTLSKKMKGSAAGTWFFNKPHIDIGILQMSQHFPRGKNSLSLWLSPSADRSGRPLADVLKVLTYPPGEAHIDGRIHSATNDGTAIFVALRPSGTAIRIDMATPLASNASLVIHATHEWLAQPIALAKALIQASRADEGAA